MYEEEPKGNSDQSSDNRNCFAMYTLEIEVKNILTDV